MLPPEATSRVPPFRVSVWCRWTFKTYAHSLESIVGFALMRQIALRMGIVKRNVSNNVQNVQRYVEGHELSTKMAIVIWSGSNSVKKQGIQ